MIRVDTGHIRNVGSYLGNRGTALGFTIRGMRPVYRLYKNSVRIPVRTGKLRDSLRGDAYYAYHTITGKEDREVEFNYRSGLTRTHTRSRRTSRTYDLNRVRYEIGYEAYYARYVEQDTRFVSDGFTRMRPQLPSAIGEGFQQEIDRVIDSERRFGSMEE